MIMYKLDAFQENYKIISFKLILSLPIYKLNLLKILISLICIKMMSNLTNKSNHPISKLLNPPKIILHIVF